MVSTSVNVRIDRPAPEVFAYVANPVNLPEWHSMVVAVKDVRPLAPGVEGGATTVGKVLGRTFETTYRAVLTETPNLKLTSPSVSGPVQHTWTYECAPADGGCDLTITLEGEPGRFFRFAEPVVMSMLTRQLQLDVETLKALLEQPAVASPPDVAVNPAPGD